MIGKNIKLTKYFYIIIGVVFGIFAMSFLFFLLDNRWEANRTSKISISDQDFILGDPNAPVVFLEYSDFQCPFCRRFAINKLPLLQQEYIDTGKVQFVWRDFILYGRESIQAANAAHCAGEQGMFWEYHDLLYFKQREDKNSGTFSLSNLKKFGQELNLDQEHFTLCIDSGRYKGEIKSSTDAARQFGVWGTPSFFINDFGPLFGDLRYKQFQVLIDAALNTASEEYSEKGK